MKTNVIIIITEYDSFVSYRTRQSNTDILMSGLLRNFILNQSEIRLDRVGFFATHNTIS